MPQGVYAVEWSFEGEKGAVTVRQEGRCAICRAISRAGERALYKAWLMGDNGRVLLGTLIPEGGALRLHRSVEISWLERQGAWPPRGAEVLEAYTLAPQVSPQGWERQEEPWRLLEGELRERARELRWAFVKRDMEGFFLALPWEKGKAFPLPSLFCLAKVKQLEGKRYIIFRFSRQGRPELLNAEIFDSSFLHNFSAT